MNNLNDLWNGFQQAQPDGPEVIASDLQSLKSKANGPIAKLKTNLLINSGFAVAGILIFGFLMFYIDQTIVQVLLGVVLLAYAANIWLNNYIHRKYLKTVLPEQDTFHYLSNLELGIRTLLKRLEQTAVFIYPISMTAGFLIPLAQENALHLLEKTEVQLILVACWVVFTPICYFVTRYLNRKAFGMYLDLIRKELDEMKSA